MHTNVRHHFFAIQAVAEGMIGLGGGSIINMGSNSCREAAGGLPAYTTDKPADPDDGPRSGRASDTGKYGRAGLDHDQTAKGLVGDRRDTCRTSEKPMPAGPD